jgi:hypothetical protein
MSEGVGQIKSNAQENHASAERAAGLSIKNVQKVLTAG